MTSGLPEPVKSLELNAEVTLFQPASIRQVLLKKPHEPLPTTARACRAAAGPPSP
jgi:hypothetical protein